MSRLLHGDCRQVLATLEADSVDAVVTDPPYGISFMARKWDAPDVAFAPDTWRAVLRVMRPGAWLLAFGGTRTFHRLACAVEDAGFEVRDTIAWLHGQGFPKNARTQLKPAHEPVLLARKPGPLLPLNIDGCRVGTADKLVRPFIPRTDNAVPGHGLGAGVQEEPFGRWPPNVTMDEAAATALDAMTGDLPGRGNKGPSVSTTQSMFMRGKRSNGGEYSRGDSGGASRFMYVAKASRSERGEGNVHPCVKPLTLMRWLVRLVTPPGGLVLDPFAGSGSTLIAASQEGCRYVGIEESAEYVDIARQRLNADILTREAP